MLLFRGCECFGQRQSWNTWISCQGLSFPPFALALLSFLCFARQVSLGVPSAEAGLPESQWQAGWLDELLRSKGMRQPSFKYAQFVNQTCLPQQPSTKKTLQSTVLICCCECMCVQVQAMMDIYIYTCSLSKVYSAVRHQGKVGNHSAEDCGRLAHDARLELLSKYQYEITLYHTMALLQNCMTHTMWP